MTKGQLPLLLFPRPTPIDRELRTSFPPTLHVPNPGRQGQRLAPKLQALQDAFDARRIELQMWAPNSDPDLVVVFETVGLVEDFISTANRIPGMEWLAGVLDIEFEPDTDFFDSNDPAGMLRGKLFLLGSNRHALEELVRLWTVYQTDQAANLGDGLNAWKQLFAHLKDVRFWGPQDRASADIRNVWEEHLVHDDQSVRFEIEAWCFGSPLKNAAASGEIRALVEAMNGTVHSEWLLAEIAYHGFLVELPTEGVRQLLVEPKSTLLLSDRVMFFRPQGQGFAPKIDEDIRLPDVAVPEFRANGDPIVALLDGLPVANHPRLQGRLAIDDPDDWAADYPVAERAHGTAMASLIIWGELDGSTTPLPNPVYVRPILRPDANAGVGANERTPSDRLLIDLFHSAVRRMYEGDHDVEPTAPTVRVINLSVGDQSRPFGGDLSPWARLLDWLAYRYKVLFIVSSGNQTDDLVLNIPRDGLPATSSHQVETMAMSALLREDSHRRLISPAESINALTVGACYSDNSGFSGIPGRYVLFADRGVAPYSCIGPGFRRAVKPDLLLPGGRVLYSERPLSPVGETHVSGVWHTPRAPGQLVATAGSAGETVYTRGTSNSAALATRAAAMAFSVIETLRAGGSPSLHSRYDAVLIKALLAHGASCGDLVEQVLSARPDVEHWHARRRLVSRYAGYGLADIDRALTCTEQRATLLGVGQLRNKKAWEFRIPVPEALNASLEKRRLTVTLAWLSPPNSRHSKYRVARLWVDLPENPLRLERIDSEARQVQMGTLQHEIFESESAVPVVGGQDIVVRVNCVADAGRLVEPVDFALCVSLEVAEGVPLAIYQQIRERVQERVGVAANAA